LSDERPMIDWHTRCAAHRAASLPMALTSRRAAVDGDCGMNGMTVGSGRTRPRPLNASAGWR